MAFFEQDGQKFEKDDRFALDFDEVKSSLSKVKKGNGGWWVARCPAHNDGRPSLSFIKSGNTVGFKCFAGCDFESIVRSLGMWKDVPEKREKIESKIVATYDYTDEAGKLLYQVVRFEPKKFLQRRFDNRGKAVWDLQGVTRTIYNLPKVLESSAEPVFIVEGEKDADNLTEAGAIATTNSGGATKWEKHFNKYFANRDVIILADNDVSGYDHAELVSKEVYRSANSVKIVQLPSDEPKYDVSNYLEEGNTLDDLLYLCREVEPLRYTEEDLAIDPSQSHNVEAEKAILGAILKNPILVGRVIENELQKHFFDKKTKAILDAVIECYNDKQDVNVITLADKFDKKSLINLGGVETIEQLEEGLPEVFDIDSWIKIVIAKSQYRELVTLGKNLSSLAEHEAQPVKMLTDTFIDKVYSVKIDDKKKGLSRLGSGLENVIVNAREAVGKGITGISTGFPDLDYMTSGWQNTDLIIIAGRPSMGKTSFAMNMAAHAAIRGGKNVAVFSLEMSEEQLISKVMCSEAYVNSFDFKNGGMQEADWARIAKILPVLDEAGLYIDDTPRIGVAEMRSKLLRLEQEGGLDMVVVDYIQLMKGSSGKNHYNKVQEVSEISADLKGLAKEFRVPLIALSQLSRAPEGRPNPEPKLSDLRESGGIEQDADVVAFMFRPEYYSPDDTDLKGLAKVDVAKQRNGPTGAVHLAWLKQYTRFMPVLEQY